MTGHSKIFSYLVVAFIAVAVFGAVQFVKAFEQPTYLPPATAMPLVSPIDQGDTGQWKLGNLGIGDPSAGLEFFSSPLKISYLLNGVEKSFLQDNSGSWSVPDGIEANLFTVNNNVVTQNLSVVNSSGNNAIFDGSKWVPDGRSVSCQSSVINPNDTSQVLLFGGQARVVDGVVYVVTCSALKGFNSLSCINSTYPSSIMSAWYYDSSGGTQLQPSNLGSWTKAAFGPIIHSDAVNHPTAEQKEGLNVQYFFNQQHYFNGQPATCNAEF